jgi:chaperone required for assembly of F1-ATPase
MIAAKFKRFYAQASWAAVPPGVDGGGGFRVLLDGKAVKTPANAEMALPNQGLAEAIAAEWQAQGEEVEVRSLVLTGLVWTAIDLVRPNRERAVAELAAYAAHDLVCYRAEAPADLAARQQAQWQPLLDWLALAFDAPLAVATGVVAASRSGSTPSICTTCERASLPSRPCALIRGEKATTSGRLPRMVNNSSSAVKLR